MNLLKILFSNPFKKQTWDRKEKVSKESKEAFVKLISDKKNNKKQKKPKSKESAEIQGNLLKIGDKVICRSNEPYPIMVGKIIEFWDNEGKWETVVPVVKNNRTGKKFNVHGIVKPYSEELMDTLRPMKPLEQWNYFVPEDVRYTEEEMKRKEEAFEKREKFLPKKK
jgi:hypothetical protein